MSSFARILFLIGDVLFLNLSMIPSCYFLGHMPKAHIVYFFIFSNLTWLFLIAVASPYSFSKNWDGAKTIKNQFIFIFIHLLVVTSLIFFYDRQYTPIQILLVYVFFTPLFYSSKFFASFLFHRLGQTKNSKNILLVSKPNLLSDVKKYLTDQPDWKYNFTEVIESASAIPMGKIRLLCQENTVDEIFVCLPDKTNLDELIDFGLGKLIPIKLLSDIRKEHGNSADEKHFDQVSYINQSIVLLDDPINKTIKRIFDLIFSLLFIATVMSWLLPIIVILIKADSKGPVFFIQNRDGERNKPFRCIKFRTMLVNTDADTKQATKNDSRITRIGTFLRKTSIDELPQFFNVFMGDMSLIGPRPHPVKLNEKFAPQIKKLISRHYVKPGITGLAQAMGYRGETSTLADMKNRVTLDRFYIENWSFILDLKIIYLTVVSLLKGSEKAY